MMNKYVVGAIKIIIYSFIAIAGTYIFFLLFNSQPLPFSLQIEKEPNIILQTLELDDSIDALDLEWYAGGVEITKSNDNKIHIVEKSSTQLDESKWVKPFVSNKTLILHSRNKTNVVFFNIQSPQSYLELQLPEQAYTKFKLLLTSGRTTITDFDVNQFDLTMTSGNLHLNDLQSDDMNITMTSGEAFFIQVHTNDLNLDMTSGNSNFTGTVKNELDVEMTSGNLDMDLSTDSPNEMNVEMTSGNATVILSETEGFEVRVDKSSGNFRTDSLIKEVNDELYQYLDSNQTYSVDMTSGSFEIKLR